MSDHFTSSDDDVEEIIALNVVPKTKHFFEHTVQLFDKTQYMQHFRVSIEKASYLADRYESSTYFKYQEGGFEKVSAQKTITIFLWFAGNEAASYRVVADRFGISKSTLHKIIKNVTYFLSNLSAEFITWPSEEEKVEIERFFRTRNFPGALGAIDGTHIRIDRPKDDPDSYLNRKHFFSLHAQIICDHNKKIRDTCIGFPGSVHDSRVLKNSEIYQTLREKCGDGFILGDSGYPCQKNLLTPFRDTGHLTRRQKNYNLLLSKNRYIVEHCFGILKQKFRQLYHLKIKNITVAVHFIRACTVLHNIGHDDSYEENQEVIDVNNIIDGAAVDQNYEADDVNGVIKRNEVMANLPVIL